VVSSTAIRKALAGGDIKKVLNLAGHPFSLSGCVTGGTGRGLGLGFPTANLAVAPEQALPADGVYATLAYIDGKTFESITNIGGRPTFGNNQRTVEVHVLDYHGGLYGSELKIDVIERLRGEKKFDTIDKLKKQITEDIKQGRDMLNYRGRN